MSTRPQQSGQSRISRRRVLGIGGAVALAGPLAPMPSTAATPANLPTAKPGHPALTGEKANPDEIAAATLELLRPDIRPRSDWAGDLPVTGEILAEEDVRFLLVHHTASTNDYSEGQVADQIRRFYEFHTGPEKGWPDVAYNFFVDRFGGIWEARAGSIEAAVRGDATGGSQGHALLCSLIGDHSKAEITSEATASLVSLLAWLAQRHGVDTTPGTTVDFLSRGSNRWAEGVTVTARTISGHRDMSQTSCPGDFAYDRLAGEIPEAVTATVSTAAAEATATINMAREAEQSTVTLVPTTEPSVESAPATEPLSDEQTAAPANGPEGGGSGRIAVLVGGIATVSAAALAGLARLRTRTFHQSSD